MNNEARGTGARPASAAGSGPGEGPPGPARTPRIAAGTGRIGALSLLTLGASAIAVQLVCLREVLSSFGGNELMAGLALGLWLLLTGIGSRLGSVLCGRLTRRGGPEDPRGPDPDTSDRSDSGAGVRSTRRALAAGHLLLAFLPFAMLAALRAPLFADVRGEIAGMKGALLGGILVFLPFTLISGAMIPAAGTLISARDALRRVYLLDTLGSAAGGLLFALLLAGFLPHGWTLALFAAVQLTAVAVVLPGPRVLRIAAPLALALPLVFAGRADHATLSWRFPGQHLVLAHNTPYGQIAVTTTQGQSTVFQDAIPFHTTGDLAVEARVHPALCQVPEGATVLLIGGGGFGAAREALKHRPSRIDCIEPDRTLFEVGEDLALLSASRPACPINSVVADARRYLRGRSAEYDAILLDVPGPQNAQLNRYYTSEFFREARAALRPEGILSFTLPASPNYLGPEQLALERSIRAALAASFARVEVLPGETHVFLAAGRPISPAVDSVLAARRIETVRLLDYDWPERSDPFRLDELKTLLSVPAAPNRDLAPRAFRHFLDLDERKRTGSRRITAALAAASLVALAAACAGSRRNLRAGIAVATSGFAVMALEIQALLLFQVLLGNLYLRIALLTTLFLAGAACGALTGRSLRLSRAVRMRAPDLLLAALALAGIVLGRLAVSEPAWSAPIATVALPIFGFAVAYAAGAQFAAAGERAEGVGFVGPLYLADLAGAAAGALWAGLVLLPRFGIAGVAIAAASVKLASMIVQMGRTRA